MWPVLARSYSSSDGDNSIYLDELKIPPYRARARFIAERRIEKEGKCSGSAPRPPNLQPNNKPHMLLFTTG
jgi:hypothetical protein